MAALLNCCWAKLGVIITLLSANSWITKRFSYSFTQLGNGESAFWLHDQWLEKGFQKAFFFNKSCWESPKKQFEMRLRTFAKQKKTKFNENEKCSYTFSWLTLYLPLSLPFSFFFSVGCGSQNDHISFLPYLNKFRD